MAKSSQVGLHVWLPMAMEGLKKSKVFFNISYNDIKSLEEILKWLESLLSRGDIPYSLFLSLLIALLAILINILIGQNGNIPERKMDLVPVTVLINGRRCVGIIDLEDPRGLLLRMLYAGNRNVSRVIVSTPDLQIAYYLCIYSNCNTSTNYTTMLSTFSFTYISVAFPSPNILVWLFLQREINLVIYTGYDQFTTRIYPIPFSNIHVRGMEDIYLATVTPRPWQNNFF